MTAGTDLWRALEAVRTGDPGHVAGSGYTRSTWEEHARVLAEELESTAAERDRLRPQVDAVRELHFDGPCASGCCPSDGCVACGEVFPCPTVRALDCEPAEPDHAPGER